MNGYSSENLIAWRFRQFIAEYPSAVLHCEAGVFQARWYDCGKLERYRTLGRAMNAVATYYRLKAIMTAREIGSGKKAA